MAPTSETILCLSHLRWNFVYQRPQHLLVRCARDHRVVYVEEPIFDASEPELELRAEGSITVAIPHLRAGTGPELAGLAQRKTIDHVIGGLPHPRPVLWYTTPMAIAFTHHFARARELVDDPPDQAAIPHPRIGFFGVIDERMDLELLSELADHRPDLQLVMIGPVVKIAPGILLQWPNLHWLGGKVYRELPAYLAGWDVAMLPFARGAIAAAPPRT